ncbi:acyltransferase family protein [Anaerovibrio lipolyticus]|uniref:acyltransferase family protein n=1 Tax=Anaerovibrio lipolyticus TaxID=82374 RepID=UPI0009073766
MVIDNSLSVKLRWTQFICAIVVVSDHAFDYIHYVHQEKYIVDNIFFYLIYMFTSGLTRIAMPMFFCISAFLLYKDWNDSTSIIQRYLYKLKSRSVSILSPYLVWNTICGDKDKARMAP